jgi:hypothetical protein
VAVRIVLLDHSKSVIESLIMPGPNTTPGSYSFLSDRRTWALLIAIIALGGAAIYFFLR